MQNSNSQSDINTKPEMSVQWISHRQPRPLILDLRSRRVYVQYYYIGDNISLILLEFQVISAADAGKSQILTHCSAPRIKEQ